jgi:hypothetical protein
MKAIWGVTLIMCSHKRDVIPLEQWVTWNMSYESSKVLFMLMESQKFEVEPSFMQKQKFKNKLALLYKL